MSGFDLPLRKVLVTIFAVAIAFLPTAIAWVFIGSYALGITAAIVGGVFWLVEARTRKGLRLRAYRALLDKRKESLGKFQSCGVEVNPMMTGYGVMHRSSMPNPFLPDPATSQRVIFGAQPAQPQNDARQPRDARQHAATWTRGDRPTVATKKPGRHGISSSKKVTRGRKVSAGDPFAAAARASVADQKSSQ
ncbi:MAG: hypothetical protein WKF57_06765 [Nakamurella sp.]